MDAPKLLTLFSVPCGVAEQVKTIEGQHFPTTLPQDPKRYITEAGTRFIAVNWEWTPVLFRYFCGFLLGVFCFLFVLLGIHRFSHRHTLNP